MKQVILFLIIAAISVQAQAQTHKPVKKTTHPVAAKPVPPPPPPPVVVKQTTDEYSVKDKNFINAGIGVGAFTVGLPFGASYEHGFTDAISGGVFASYLGYTYPDSYKLHIFYGGIRASYHFAKLFNVTNPKFDPYAGVSVGYYNSGFDGFVNPYPSTIFVGVHAGARYLFADKIGAFAEVGYGVSALNVGITFKL